MTGFYGFSVKSEKEKRIDIDPAADAEVSCGYLTSGKEDGFVEVYEKAKDALKLYSCGDKTVLYCADGYIYSLSVGGEKLLIDHKFGNPPAVFGLYYDGSDYIAASDGITVYISGKTFATPDIPAGSFYAFAGGRLFCADGKLIRFGKVSAASKPLASVEKANINLGEEITALESDGEKIYAFCKNFIYELTVKGDVTDFKLKKTVKTPYPIQPHTVKKTGDRIYFISACGIYEYYGKKAALKARLKESLSDYGEAISHGGRYYVPIKKDGKAALVCFDPNSENYFYLSAEGLIFSDSGVAINRATGETGDFNRMVYGGEDLWKSKPIDFDTDGRKHLTGISVDAEKNVIVNIKGEFGSKNITLKANSKKRRLNLVSDRFVFTVSGIENSSVPLIRSIRLYYRENDKT